VVSLGVRHIIAASTSNQPWDMTQLNPSAGMDSASAQRWLWWVKRDMRVQDNAALCALADNDYQVMALFVFEPSLGSAPETSPLHALAQRDALLDLKKRLAQRGVTLTIAIGEVTDVLSALVNAIPFTGIVSHEETGSDITYCRDKLVAQWVQRNRVRWKEFPQNTVVRKLATRDNRRQVVAQRIWDTPIHKAPDQVRPWMGEALLENLSDNDAVRFLRDVPSAGFVTRWSTTNTDVLTISERDDFLSGRQIVSETTGLHDLSTFLNDRGFRYSGGISSPNTAFTAGSRISSHLAWGTVSLRTAFHESSYRQDECSNEQGPHAGQWKRSLRGFQSRLYWHDHFIQRLESAPSMEFKALNPAYRDVQFIEDEALAVQRLQAWRHGQTGIPLIDACMRCLMTTGFLNFRMRAMLVTTACFGLQLDWRRLLHPLAQVFADYEPGIHIAQIQMQAGMVGINTLRVYSPQKQLLDQDPDVRFVKRWVPELAEFSADQISQYETCALGDYQRPIANITANAKVIKDQLYAIKRSETGRSGARETLDKHGSRMPASTRVSSPASRKRSKKRPTKPKTSDRQMSFDW